MIEQPHERTTLTVNGKAHDLQLPNERLLLDVLREDLGLTGTKKACDNGECGSCIVQLGRKPAKSCLLAAKRAEGKEVTTIEGLSPEAAGLQPGDDLTVLHPLQQAFQDHHALLSAASEGRAHVRFSVQERAERHARGPRAAHRIS